MCNHLAMFFLLPGLTCLSGCLLGYLLAESVPFTAHGTWTGTIEPVVLEGDETGRQVIGTRLIVSNGPELRQEGKGATSGISTIGRDAILVDKKKQVLSWRYPTSEARSASVTGSWNSHNRHSSLGNEPMLQPAGFGGVRDLYNVIITDRVEVAPPNTAPATTRSTAITLRAELVSPDQIDLSWTAFAGTATYRIELSEDGVDYHESLEVEAPATSASLVGFEEAQSGQDHHIRVVARDAKGRTVATSNVCVIRSPP